MRNGHNILIYSAFDCWGLNATSTLADHFVLPPRDREKRDRIDGRGDEREGQVRKRKRNESKETEEIKTFPLYLTCYLNTL